MNQNELTSNLMIESSRNPDSACPTPTDEAIELMKSTAPDVEKLLAANQVVIDLWKKVAEALAKGDWSSACQNIALADVERERMFASANVVLARMFSMSAVQPALHKHAHYVVRATQLVRWCSDKTADELREALEEHERICHEEQCDTAAIMRAQLAQREPH